jgi:hypothetical protein
MTSDEHVRVVNALTGLAEILDAPLTPGRIAGYLLALDDLEADDLVQAVGQAARECQFFPKPVELRDFARALARRRAVTVSEALKDAERNAAAGRILSADENRQIEAHAAIAARAVEQFKREYPDVLAAPPFERVGKWMTHMRQKFAMRSMPEAK